MKPRCTGRSKTRDGEPCKNYPVHGAKVCRNHGGAAPQVRAAAARRLVEAEAIRAVSKFGTATPIADPLAALSEVVGEMVAVKNWIRGRVDKIDDELMRTTDDKNAEQMRAEWTAYTGMLNSCVSALAAIGKMNIDERMARIEEARKTMIIEAMRRGFAAAGVTGEAHTRGLAATVKHLRVVGS